MTRHRSYELFTAAALAALVGCSGETPTALSFSPAGSRVNGMASAAVVETLRARRITVKKQSCGSGAGSATFTYKGKAKGRVRGKLLAKGAWSFSSVGGETLWIFSETFRIKGKHPADGTITGSGTDAVATCTTFGPVSNKELTYHFGTLSGAATTNLMKNGAKILQRLL